MKSLSQPSLVLSADFACMYLLAEALAQRGATTVVRLFDYLAFYRAKPRWSPSSVAHLRREVWLFPPGYGGKFERLCRPWISGRIANVVRRLAVSETGAEIPWLIVPFPYLTASLRAVPPTRVIYYNLDDYSCYPKGWSPRVERLEEELVERSSVVVCAARVQVENFRRRFPHKRVEHLPLAVPPEFLNHDPQQPTCEGFNIGYVGTLNDRVDWSFCAAVAALCPEMLFTFVGPLHDASPKGGTRRDWLMERTRVLAMPNVRYLAPVPHAEVVRFYREFAVNWIPYDTTHPFNVASCPTKIMDGLASGRPILSTGLPECRLYPEWISVVEDAAAAASELRRMSSVAWDAHERERALRQVAYTAAHTWRNRVEDLTRWLTPAGGVTARPAYANA